MKKILKWTLIVVGGFFGLMILIAMVGSKGQGGQSIQKSFEEGNKVGAGVGNQTSQPVEKFNIVVTSQIVKKVDSKYRYFFDIRNKDANNFEGKVIISVYNQLGNNIWDNPFQTESPIKPNMGDSVYFDINTGPVSVHGENGISKFKYVVEIGDNTVNEGEGEISTKLEDTNKY